MTDVVRTDTGEVLRSDRDVLRYLGLDPSEASTVALFRLAARYGLDPLLRQVEVLDTKQGPRAYISRDGYLALAHRTGELRGIRTVEEYEGETGWRAVVEVLTVDGGVYTDSAGCGRTEPQVIRGGVDGLRMAIARAERRALKRAFSALPAQTEDDEPNLELKESAGEVTTPRGRTFGPGQRGRRVGVERARTSTRGAAGVPRPRPRRRRRVPAPPWNRRFRRTVADVGARRAARSTCGRGCTVIDDVEHRAHRDPDAREVEHDLDPPDDADRFDELTPDDIVLYVDGRMVAQVVSAPREPVMVGIAFPATDGLDYWLILPEVVAEALGSQLLVALVEARLYSPR